MITSAIDLTSLKAGIHTKTLSSGFEFTTISYLFYLKMMYK
jgi:hypothetical protein